MTRDEKQKEAIQKWIAAKCRGSLVWSTGVGKTRAGLIAIKSFISTNKNRNIKVIVPTDHLKVQWIAELSKYNLLNYVSVEIINSAIKKVEVVDLLILDEIHRYLADSFFRIFQVKNPKYILGLSATFTRLDGKHQLLYKYCPPIDVVTTKEAIKNGWLSPYIEYKVLIKPDDIGIYNQFSKDFNNSFSTFNYDFNTAMKCVTNVRYRRYYGKTLGFSAKDIDAISFTWNRALRERKSYIMNHPKKLEITRKILEARPFAKAITFSGTIKQAEQIGGGYIVHSGKTKKKNRLTKEEFSLLTSGVLHSSKSLDEGVDIKGLNLAIILYNSSSKTQKIQRVTLI